LLHPPTAVELDWLKALSSNNQPLPIFFCIREILCQMHPF